MALPQREKMAGVARQLSWPADKVVDAGQSGVAPLAHVPHKSEQTLLYELVEQYWPEFQTQLSESGLFGHGRLRASSSTTWRVVGLRTVFCACAARAVAMSILLPSAVNIAASVGAVSTLCCQLQSYFTDYQEVRTHLSLANQSPRPRAVESPD